MSTNLAQIIGGPCLIKFAGSTFRSKGDVSLNLELDTFEIVNDLYGAVDKRVAGQPIKLSFTPEGRFADVDVLFAHASAAIGSLITPVRVCGAVVPADDTVAVADVSLPAGTAVSFGTVGTMPAGLTAATLYYLSADTAGLRTVHTSQAAAIAGTGKVNITDAGAGVLKFVIQRALEIIGNDGERTTFHNAAVSKMPALKLASTESMFGDVEFEAFAKNGSAWADAGSFYTIDEIAFSDTGFDPSDIITQPYSLTWGASPWAGLFTKSGISIDNTLSLEPVEDDASGIISRRISAIGFTVKAQPQGPDLEALLAKLKIQGAGATRGRSLAGDDLNIEGTGVYARLYAAALTGGPANWSSKNDRLGELTWQATRTFSGGVANPLFYIGEEAPE